jgi:hypothetical protein
MALFYSGLHFAIYNINDQFGIGFAVGGTLGVFIGALGTLAEQYNKRRGEEGDY